MLHKKAKKESGNATRASVKKEMAKPRMASLVNSSAVRIVAPIANW
jgi:hypothetical protein